MSICPNTHHHCYCQPDEGMDCPHGPTPAEQPAPASTGRANMDIWNAEAQALAEVPSLPPLPLGIGSGEFINVTDAKAWGAACFAAGRGAAIRDYVSLQPVAARELDVEADPELLNESIDTEGFYELACSWRDGGDALWSDIIDHIYEYTKREVAAARSAAQGTQPESAPVSTEQAGDAPPVTYRLLDTRDIIEPTDEWLAGDAVTWRVNPSALFHGCPYASFMLPARRIVAPSPNNSPVGAAKSGD